MRSKGMDSILDTPKSCQTPGLEPLKAAWGDYIDEAGRQLSGWDWFATLTFRNPERKVITKHTLDGILCPGRSYQVEKFPGWTKPGWKYAHRALRELGDKLMSKRLGDTVPYWIGCMEYQHWRGVPHWHVLVGNTGVGTQTEERRMDWVDWWWSHYGIARILPYEERLGARYYLGKYLTKELADVVTSPQLTLRYRQRSQQHQANAAWVSAMTSG